MKLLDRIVQPDRHQKLLKDAKKFATEQGGKGMPSPDAIHLDKHELEFKHEADQLIANARKAVHEHVIKIDRKVADKRAMLETLQGAVSHRPELDSLVSNVGAELRADEEGYVRALRKRISAEGYLNSFRVANDIHHEPDHPHDFWLFMSWAFIICVGESILNSYFWKGDDGLIGGVVIATIFAVLNMGVAFILGVGFTYKNLHAQKHRLLGWFCFAAAIAAAILIASWIGTQRASKEIDKILSPNFDAIFSSPTNALFFAMTIVAACVGFYKGYHAAGTIPGYKRVTDDFNNADKAVEALKKNLSDRCSGIFDKGADSCASMIRNFSEALKELTTIRADLGSIRHEYTSISNQIREQYVQIMGVYRNSNLASRPSGIPGPAYWGNPLDLDTAEPAELARLTEDNEGLLAQTNEIANSFQDELHQERTKIVTSKGEFFLRPWMEYLNGCKVQAETQFTDNIHHMGALR